MNVERLDTRQEVPSYLYCRVPLSFQSSLQSGRYRSPHRIEKVTLSVTIIIGQWMIYRSTMDRNVVAGHDNEI